MLSFDVLLLVVLGTASLISAGVHGYASHIIVRQLKVVVETLYLMEKATGLRAAAVFTGSESAVCALCKNTVAKFETLPDGTIKCWHCLRGHI